jgi:uncharacterized protein (TIGR03083 family)
MPVSVPVVYRTVQELIGPNYFGKWALEQFLDRLVRSAWTLRRKAVQPMVRHSDLAVDPDTETAGHLDVLDAEGRQIIGLASRHGLAGEISGCPGWTMRELVAHLGFVYRWAGTIVGEARSGAPSTDERAALQDPDPGDDDGVITRTEQARARLVTTLREAPPTLDCWTIWPVGGPPRDFWIRRQLHETLVHRVDAQSAAGLPSGGEDLDPAIAADGVDEMVCGFAGRYRQRLRAESPRTLALTATDTGHRWWIGLSPDDPVFGRGLPPGTADAEVHGRSGELLMLLWNRRTCDGLDLRGDRGVVDDWHRNAHL